MLTLAAWLHNIDPFAIQFPEGFILPGIRWYGLAYLATFAIGFFFTKRVVQVGVSTLRPVEVMDFVISVAIGVVVGGRLGYVVFYKPELFLQFSSSPPFWGVFELGGGGMSSHGGMIGVGVVTWWYAWRSQRKHALNPQQPVHAWLHLFDLCALVATLGFLFGRLANFINAELIGRVCSPDLPWAVKFPQELFEVSARWAAGDAKAGATLVQLTPAVEQLVLDVKGARVTITPEVWADTLAKGDLRFVDEAIRGLIHAIQDGGSRGRLIGEHVEPLLQPHHPSQLYAMITEGLIIFLVLLWIWRKPRKPGVICGMFGAMYGVMRVFNEFFRTPDAHIADQEFATLGLTRGQLLSIVLAIGGVALTWWASRRNVAKMGGWLPVKQG